MSESPKSAAPDQTAAPPYTPSGAAASERLLKSVLGRLAGSLGASVGRWLDFADQRVGSIVDDAGRGKGRGPGQRLFAQPPDAPSLTPDEQPLPSAPHRAGGRPERIPPAKDLLTGSPRGADLKLPPVLRPTMTMASAERMFGNKGAHDPRAVPGGATDRPALSVLSTGWESLGSASAPELDKKSEVHSPLASAPPSPNLNLLIAAVADLDKSAAAQHRESPSLELLHGGAAPEPRDGTAAKGTGSVFTQEQAHQIAIESSKQLMDAMRAHAMAHSSSDRVSLGDMALISFADSTKQMAAAETFTSGLQSSHSNTSGKQPGPLPGSGKDSQEDLHNQLLATAKLVFEDLKQVKKFLKERFGAHG